MKLPSVRTERLVHDSQIAIRDWDDCKHASFTASLRRSYNVAGTLARNNDKLIGPCRKELRMSEQTASCIAVMIP